jgi:hypothetical protein
MKPSEILDAALRCRPLTGNVNRFAREIERMVRAEIADDLMRASEAAEQLRAKRCPPVVPGLALDSGEFIPAAELHHRV